VIYHHWADRFNDWINRWGLIEIKNPAKTYTWFKNQERPIMAALDRILINADFELVPPGQVATMCH